jgi:ABC-type uncharacterized transport system permease subunit
MIENFFTFAFLFQTLRITVPYFLPSLGAVYSERGGVINIALEGILLVSAFITASVVFFSNNIFLGIFAGASSGLLMALIHALVSITFKADQLVSGIALNLLAAGATRFFCQYFFGSSSNSPRIIGLETVVIPHPFLILCLVLLLLSGLIIYKTKFGLRLRAVGENPEAADSLGICVSRIRYAGVLISGVLAGLGGCWLAFDQHSFTDGMSAGRGFIALAAMIIGKWNPFGAAAACLLFGLAESLAIQFYGSFIPTQFIVALPYIATIIVLAGFIGKSTPPAADGVPYEKSA